MSNTLKCGQVKKSKMKKQKRCIEEFSLPNLHLGRWCSRVNYKHYMYTNKATGCGHILGTFIQMAHLELSTPFCHIINTFSYWRLSPGITLDIKRIITQYLSKILNTQLNWSGHSNERQCQLKSFQYCVSHFWDTLFLFFKTCKFVFEF